MEAKTKTIETFKTHAKDTGSADVQIALLTHRINHLTEHLQTAKKDHSSPVSYTHLTLPTNREV